MMQVSGWKVEFAPGTSDLERAVIEKHLVKKPQETKVIKKGQHRIVERVKEGKIDIHAKTNYLHNLRAKLRRFLRPSKAQLEFSVLRELENAGVKSLEPLAWSEEPHFFGRSILYTKTLEDSETLEELWKKNWAKLDPKSKHTVCKQFALLLSKMHGAGLFHPDPHPGNILVTVPSFDLRVIDLHNPIRKQNPTLKDRKIDISGWSQWGSLRLENRDLARILKHYLVHSGLGEFKKWWNSISNHTTAVQKRFWSRQESLCLHSGHRRFIRIREKGISGIGMAEFGPLLTKIAKLFSNMDARQIPFEVLKSSLSSQVYRTNIENLGLVIKVIPKKKGIKSYLLNLLGSDPAKNQWYWSNALRLRLLPTPRILGWYQNSKTGCSYVLAEELSGALQLDRWLERSGDNSSSRYGMIWTLARAIRTLHQRGLYNRDMKAANIMVDTKNQIYWVDLGGIGHLSTADNHRKLKDLARLAGSFWYSKQVTHSDRLRFLKIYLTSEEWASSNWKVAWKFIERRSLQRIRARTRAGRALG